MQKDKKFYDDFFTKHPANVHDSPARFLAVSALLTGRVLDVACGTGTLESYYNDDYFGVDISDVAVAAARKVRRETARFSVGDFTRPFSIPNREFDSVYLGEFLEHIEDDKVVFENISKMLALGGRIVATVPNGDRVPDESHCRTFTAPSIRRKYSKYGRVTFHDWVGQKNRLLFTIEPSEEPKNEMSLVMIVKDEEKGIEKAVLSALPLVDNVVISVDSKSKDKTIDLAKMYADVVKFHDWNDDFSAARNFAQEGVETKWILFLDGHEYIDQVGDYKEKMKSDVDGIFVTIRMESGMTFLFPRIYRSHIKFKNKVHNVNVCKTRRVEPNFVIVHDRPNLQSIDSATRRNKQREKLLPEQMKKQIAENPKNARAHFHLANFYMMRKKIDLALKHYKQVIKHGISPDEKYMAILHYGALHMTKGHWWRALWNFNKADKLMPGRWESARVIGGFYYNQKHWKKAIPFLVEALGPNSRRFAYEPMQRNLSETWDMIGQCFAQSDQNEKALVAWERAMQLTKDKKQKALIEQKRSLVKTLLSTKEEQTFTMPQMGGGTGR